MHHIVFDPVEINHEFGGSFRYFLSNFKQKEGFFLSKENSGIKDLLLYNYKRRHETNMALQHNTTSSELEKLENQNLIKLVVIQHVVTFIHLILQRVGV